MDQWRSLLHALLQGYVGSFPLDSWNLSFHLADGKEEQELHVEFMGRSGRLCMSFLLLLCGTEFCHVGTCDSKIKLANTIQVYVRKRGEHRHW